MSVLYLRSLTYSGITFLTKKSKRSSGEEVTEAAANFLKTTGTEVLTTWHIDPFTTGLTCRTLPQKLKQCLVKIEFTSGDPVTPEKTRVCR